MYNTSDNIATLERKTNELESNGLVADALLHRERLLVLTQRVHGDKTPEADQQKYKFALLALRWANERPDASPADVAAGSGFAALRGKSSKRQLPRPSSAASRGLTMPAKTPPPTANSVRHTKCFHPEADESASAVATSFLKAAPGQQSLFAGLSVASCLALAENLISEQQTTAEAQFNVTFVELRGRLLLAQVAHFHRARRPRAALPLLQKAIQHLEKAAAMVAPDGAAPASVELAEAHLTLCVLLSAANHHGEALAAAHNALALTLVVEERRWLADPLRQDPDAVRRAATAAGTTADRAGRPPRADSVASPSSVKGGAAAKRPTSAGPERTDPAIDLSRVRTTIYCGPLQAACYHNIGVEQEHLGLCELALESFQTGFELAFLSLGAADVLTLRLKLCYAELFASLNCRHFGPAEAMQRTAVQRVMDDPQRALARLKESYERSVKHNATLLSETSRQQRLLHQSFAASSSRPGSASRSRTRPSSAQSATRVPL